MNMAVFDKRIFENVIKLKISTCDHHELYKYDLNSGEDVT